MDKRKLIKMLADAVTRQQLIDCEVIKISIYSKAREQLEVIDESRFFEALASANCDNESGGYFTIDLEEFWFDIFQLPLESHQATGSFSISIVTYREERERRRLDAKAEKLANVVFGDIEIV